MNLWIVYPPDEFVPTRFTGKCCESVLLGQWTPYVRLNIS